MRVIEIVPILLALLTPNWTLVKGAASDVGLDVDFSSCIEYLHFELRVVPNPHAIIKNLAIFENLIESGETRSDSIFSQTDLRQMSSDCQRFAAKLQERREHSLVQNKRECFGIFSQLETRIGKANQEDPKLSEIAGIKREFSERNSYEKACKIVESSLSPR